MSKERKYYQLITDACSMASDISKFQHPDQYVVVMQDGSGFYVLSSSQLPTDATYANDKMVAQYLNGDHEWQSNDHPLPDPVDQPDPMISVPLGRNEMMLIGLALREYRYKTAKLHRDNPAHAHIILVTELVALEKKILSNEISWQSLHGSGNPTHEPK